MAIAVGTAMAMLNSTIGINAGYTRNRKTTAALMDKNTVIGSVKQITASAMAVLCVLVLVAAGGIAYRVEAATDPAVVVATEHSVRVTDAIPIRRSITISIVTAAVR